MFKLNKSSIHLGNCLELLYKIPDKSIDMILADLPYGTTRNKWDSVLCLHCLWKHYNRVIKDNGAIVLTSIQPFTSILINSNLKYYKYSWIWKKPQGTNQLSSKYRPLRDYESIDVFYKSFGTYNIQFEGNELRTVNRSTNYESSSNYNYSKPNIVKSYKGRYPKMVLEFKRVKGSTIHPTQKPVKLFEYLIKTYTNENEIVLDNTAGSFTTAIACINTNRKFICMEKEEDYFYVGYDRIYNHIQDKKEEDKDFKFRYEVYDI